MFKAVITKLTTAFTGGTSAGTFHPSQICPECGSKLFRPDAAQISGWQCPNVDCPVQIRKILAHWCSQEAMDIPGGDVAMAAMLVERGIARNVAELYKIKARELAALPGMDKITAQKFFDAITASMKRDAPQLLFGLAIPLVGQAEAEALGTGFPTVDAVFAAGVSRLMKDARVAEPVARSIVEWHSDSVTRKLVKRLLKIGLNFKSALYDPTGAKSGTSNR
jgi:DNA ligase (NAD+)